ncbi:hypothetical protein [Bradyrhizobium sp. SSUT77]|uniref:hypothetical protein n=1 Tax=Bradyrhizobium sp. SSUT77 TaxID=3040603 RepID=UPI00244A7CC4|nr:hypothetical protein [Bradyrhizobium sp. SSUT77]MDH2347169.1 hypothetical protein [Bradyrhizobium sp. SSUT77]
MLLYELEYPAPGIGVGYLLESSQLHICAATPWSLSVRNPINRGRAGTRCVEMTIEFWLQG